MTVFLFRRLLQSIFVLLLTSVIVFAGVYAIGDPLEILAPDGKRVVGAVKAFDSETLTLDFNHPLAGQAMRFTVRLIGIL